MFFYNSLFKNKQIRPLEILFNLVRCTNRLFLADICHYKINIFRNEFIKKLCLFFFRFPSLKKEIVVYINLPIIDF
jgi:hypothetical protein